jgi:salicylate hydroxylase
VSDSRTVFIAGAGIGGLTAALALAKAGFRAVIFEQADELHETGAGIQLSPNATRVLIGLGMSARLESRLVAPDSLLVRHARTGREIVRMPLGSDAASRYGAPFWVLHRADLQAALLEAVGENPDVLLMLGSRVEDFAEHADGLTVKVRRAGALVDERGIALVGADGLWSVLRERLGDKTSPIFARRKAWRAAVPADAVPEEFREPVVQLWLGYKTHLVHYPVRGGQLINIVAITRETQAQQSWGEPADRDALLAHFLPGVWSSSARTLLDLPDRWLTWALHDRPAPRNWGQGRMTLLGDAAHPMLPFLAQGAGAAIEDAAVLADCLKVSADAPATAMRRYESLRRARTAKIQGAARFTGALYHLRFPASVARNLALRRMGGEKLRARYDWLYDWSPST